MRSGGAEVGRGGLRVGDPLDRGDLLQRRLGLRGRLAEKDCVTLFISEGAGLDAIVAEIESRGEVLGRDPFGLVKIYTVKVGKWFADRFGPRLGVEKALVQKSGHFARSAAPNADDLRLIQSMVDLAVECALKGVSGVIGHDEEHGDRLQAIAFPRIRGGKAFDPTTPWFTDLLHDIGQA